MFLTNGKVAWLIPYENQLYFKLGPLPWDTTGKWYVVDYPDSNIKIMENV